MVKKIKGSFLFKITGSDGKVVEWLVDLKNGNGTVTKSPGMEPESGLFVADMIIERFFCVVSGKKGDCTVSMKDADFMDMVSGKLNGQKVCTFSHATPFAATRSHTQFQNSGFMGKTRKHMHT